MLNSRATLPWVSEGAKVLIVTEAHRAIPHQAGNHSKVVTDQAALEKLDDLEGQFDAALIDGALETEPWDRWTLQCVHRLLRPDGAIVVVVPPLTSAASALDLRFLAYASRRLLVHLIRRVKPRFRLDGKVRRRYRLPGLARKLEALGYTGIEARSGWPGRSWRTAWRACFARRAVVTARKGCSHADADVPRRGSSHALALLRRYAEECGRFVAQRQSWLHKHPQFRGVAAGRLDPQRWRDARILVLSPHPDDELIGCGGTLCEAVSAGASVSILQATDGSKLLSLRDLPEPLRKTTRLDEAKRVAGGLGAELVVWGHEDGRLECSDESIHDLARLLDHLQPAFVFTPFLIDLHPDHRALSRILARALAIVNVELEVLQYEVWCLVPANRYCEVGSRRATVERLLLFYKRAMRHDDFVHLCESRNFARALELTGEPGYVEAFLSTPSAEFQRLVEGSASIPSAPRARLAVSAATAASSVRNTAP